MKKSKYPPGLHHALSNLRKGGLHRALGVPEGEPIPKEKLEKAKNSDDEHVRRMAQFAGVLEGFHHGGEKK
jgi:hypothetical protein